VQLVKDSIRMLRERHAYLFDDRAIQDEFRQYVSHGAEELDADFRAAHGAFKTSVRGFKIRGSYDTVEQAQKRAETLRKADKDRYNVFVAEVGCWCPWNPSVEHVETSEFAETQLNTLVKKYNESLDARDELYAERKDTLIKAMDADREVAQKLIKQQQQDRDAKAKAAADEATATAAAAAAAAATASAASAAETEAAPAAAAATAAIVETESESTPEAAPASAPEPVAEADATTTYVLVDEADKVKLE
jgi:hypothetical protein